MPMPRADSTTPRSTPRTAVNVNVKIGGMARSTSAITTGMSLRPNQITPITSTANDGIAWPMLATLMVNVPERRLRPSSSPPGTAITTAITIAFPHNTRCSMTRCGMPSGPCQLAGSLNQTRR